mgnify:CR=1 FL=1
MANVGDLIRINSDWTGDCPTLKVGDIAEIERVEHGDEHYVKGHKFDDGDDFFLFEGEFDIFRKAGEEDVEFDNSYAAQADRIKHAGTELTELLVRKNHDYGDSFAKQYEKYGLMSALIRMDDKMRRLETLLGGTDAQVDESIKDTLLDLAGYALLASIEASKEGVK